MRPLLTCLFQKFRDGYRWSNPHDVGGTAHHCVPPHHPEHPQPPSGGLRPPRHQNGRRPVTHLARVTCSTRDRCYIVPIQSILRHEITVIIVTEIN